MLAEFVEKILELKRDPVTMIDGRKYWTDNHREVGKPADLESIAQVNTLAAFVSFLRHAERPADNLRIVVKGPRQVALITEANMTYGTRETLITAKYDCDDFPFDRFMDIEEFIVKVQCLFCDTEAKSNLIASVSTIRGEEVTEHSDDGITQSVARTSKHGRIGSKEKVEPIMDLAPFRTFSDVDQPDSTFLLRLKQRQGERPLAALFEIDGGTWRWRACKKVSDWLRSDATVKELGIPVIG